MSSPLRLILLLHNHQPIGNFDGVFEQAFEDSYRPFLDVFEPYQNLRIALHTSGPLMEWLDQHHPEYLDRLAALVDAGRIEIVGGPFYEPILTMIPPRDRQGQIESYTDWLKQRLGANVRGMWTPERVWEQSLTSDLAAAGMNYTVLDDFHFKNAGLDPSSLFGYFVTEDSGSVMSVFPGSERLRYLIPFADPQESIDYLGHVQSEHPGGVVVFGDDGEKFGVWPDTKQHVFEHGWLARFFDALSANQDWIEVTTPSDVLQSVAPLGRIYIPEGSYREMTEWALPSEKLQHLEDLRHDLERSEQWGRVAPFVRGGYWRNFKVKYPETNEMYARMQMISKRLDSLAGRFATDPRIDVARRELYRGQCNCGYWHGAFGGTYLPHLRNAVFRHLIAADNLLNEIEIPPGAVDATRWADAASGDFDFDGRPEIQFNTDRLFGLLAPASGGALYELDVRSICHNLLATLTRQPEAYHRKVLAGPSAGDGDVSSIHDRVVFKQEGLHERVQYDAHARKSLLDHFYDLDTSLHDLASGNAAERGDFLGGIYVGTIRREPGRIQIQQSRDGNASGHPLRISKTIVAEAGSDALAIRYVLEGLPHDVPLNFAVEFNFAGLPAGADDRYFHNTEGENLGHLGCWLDLQETDRLGLIDHWLGVDVNLTTDRPSGFWTFPVETVSQSEGGFELVHQSVVVLPHWVVTPDAEGRWSVDIGLSVNTSEAAARMASPSAQLQLI